MRGIIFGIVLLSAGAAIGWIAAPVSRAPAPTAQEPVKSIEIVTGDADIARLDAERDRLEAENEELVGQVTQLLEQQAQWLEAAGIQGPSDANAAIAPEPGRDRERRGDDRDSPEARARREEFMRENARRMQEFEDRIAAQITDPAGIERYNALMELRDYQEQLRDEFRDAQTDEERDAVRGKMEDARRSGRQMVNEQQDTLLRGIASANGISDPQKQAAFVSAMRETLESPFFELEGMLVGGGGPGRGGFPFGGGGGGRRGGGTDGGRPPGQFQSGERN